MPQDTLSLLFADGDADELAPFTERCVKAAVPFGGEYRVIDFVLSNCLHSGLRRVLVFAGTRSYPLHKHLRDGWTVFNPELGEYITLVSGLVQEELHGYGMLDRVVENRHILERSRARRVLIADAGQIYRMDYAALIRGHCECAAEITMAVIPEAQSHSALRPRVVTDQGQSGPDRVTLIANPGVSGATPGKIAMGVDVIELDLLLAALDERIDNDGYPGDLELDLVAPLVNRVRVNAYNFGGSRGRVSRDRFWTDLSDLDAYFKANMALIKPDAPLDLYQQDWPVWSRAERNPPARTVESRNGNEGIFVNSIVSNGTVIRGGAVSRSVLARRGRIEDAAALDQCILFHDVQVGERAALERCIVGEHARIPPGERIGFDARADAARFKRTPEGIVIIPAGWGASASMPAASAA